MIRSFWQSLRCALAGFGHVIRSQRNARIHLVATLLVIVAAAALRVTVLEWAVLALSIGAVWVAECANTALEALVDLVTPEYHERAKVAKDAAAAGVLMVALAAIVVAVCVFGRHLAELVR